MSQLNEDREELRKRLKVFQDYTASWGYPMNREVHYKGLDIVIADIEKLLDHRLQAFADSLIAQAREYEVTDLELMDHHNETPLIAIPVDTLNQLLQAETKHENP